MDALRALGCDQYQGFLFSPARQPEEFERLIRAQTQNDLDPVQTHSKLAGIRTTR